MSPAWLSESDLEEAVLEWFRELGYEANDARSIAPEQVGAERESFEDVVLVGRLREALLRLNPDALSLIHI